MSKEILISKFIIFVYNNRRNILLLSNIAMWVNTLIAIIAVCLGVFEIFGMFFWNWIISMTSFLITHKVFGRG